MNLMNPKARTLPVQRKIQRPLLVLVLFSLSSGSLSGESSSTMIRFCKARRLLLIIIVVVVVVVI